MTAEIINNNKINIIECNVRKKELKLKSRNKHEY